MQSSFHMFSAIFLQLHHTLNDLYMMLIFMVLSPIISFIIIYFREKSSFDLGFTQRRKIRLGITFIFLTFLIYSFFELVLTVLEEMDVIHFE